MPTKKKTAKKTAKKKAAAKKPAKSFEETLWDTANKLRRIVESSDGRGATATTRQGCPKCECGGANQNGVAGFDSVHLPPAISILFRFRFAPVALANGSMSTNTNGEDEIRQKLVENELVDGCHYRHRRLAA